MDRSPITWGDNRSCKLFFTVRVDDKMGKMYSKFSGNTQSDVIPKHVSRIKATHGSIFGENVIILVVTAKSLELSSWPRFEHILHSGPIFLYIPFANNVCFLLIHAESPLFKQMQHVA